MTSVPFKIHVHFAIPPKKYLLLQISVFACYGRASGAMMKRTRRLDSAHQIGLSTSSKGKLIIVGECVTGGFENRENRNNRKWFCLLWKNRWCYYETDTTVGFSASNRSIHVLKREVNNSWRMC